jgi:tripeptide aminopeptidase
MTTDRDWFERDVLDRFLSYVKIHTTSERYKDVTPSTPGQWDLARLLAGELTEMGVEDVNLNEQCYLIARIPGNAGGTAIGFMAHIDTSPDLTGRDVRPQVHEKYNGGPVRLNDTYTLDPAVYPELLRYQGETIITTDGTTLLGADDKAGVAEIMTAVKYLLAHPEIPRPDLEVIFTPDEETGDGMDNFPRDEVKSSLCYTLDGSDEGSLEAECFTAFRATVNFTGYSIHPGTARGKLANATSMAAHFLSMLPRSESPEATDGRYGFYMPSDISGGIDSAVARLIVRDFDMASVQRRLEFLETAARVTEGAFPGGKVEVTAEQQYLNMAEYMKDTPEVVDNALEAIRRTGIEPVTMDIRGGTDGARLSEMGIPTPNIFTGGQNFHGRYEWVGLPAMVRACKTIVNLVQLFT